MLPSAGCTKERPRIPAPPIHIAGVPGECGSAGFSAIPGGLQPIARSQSASSLSSWAVGRSSGRLKLPEALRVLDRSGAHSHDSDRDDGQSSL